MIVKLGMFDADTRVVAHPAASLCIILTLPGAIGARIGGAAILRGTARVTFWRVLTMAITAGIGSLLGTTV